MVLSWTVWYPLFWHIMGTRLANDIHCSASINWKIFHGLVRSGAHGSGNCEGSCPWWPQFEVGSKEQQRYCWECHEWAESSVLVSWCYAEATPETFTSLGCRIKASPPLTTVANHLNSKFSLVSQHLSSSFGLSPLPSPPPSSYLYMLWSACSPPPRAPQYMSQQYGKDE